MSATQDRHLLHAEAERKIGSRLLRAGQTVRITGERGLFRIERFDGGEVHCWGGTPGREKWRVFRAERIGRRPRMSGGDEQ